MSNHAVVSPLAGLIVECVRRADAEGLPQVAAHLDAALVALRGEGVWPEEAANEGR